MLLEPKNFRWPYLAGHAALTLRKADAIPYFQAAGKLAPDNEALLVTHGNLLFQLGRYNDARDILRNALAINAESSAARVSLACISLINGDLDAARQIL
ncbi:MAG: tetratricopeptide repeat protein [Pseudomonadota bacterium]